MVAGTVTRRSSLIIGTRGSRLALGQAEWIQSRLKRLAPDLSITLRTIKTSGDKILDVPLAAIGGKGLFVKEIEEALLSEEIDLAVHSMKDVPSKLPDGLAILGIPEREDPRDVLISGDGRHLAALPAGARIGTSSLRRQAQLLHHRPDLRIDMLRGNLDTRLRKVRSGDYEAIVLAAAGLTRMGWLHEVTEYLPVDISLPAIGQGALGIEARQNDPFVRDLLLGLDHPPTRLTVLAERAFLERLEGGCQVPIAGHAVLQGQGKELVLDGLIASIDGRRVLRQSIRGAAAEGPELGRRLAEQLLASGGGAILDEVYGRA
jgi:hydroxymethylbilane synthase